ncbi:MAG: hypothetical protein GX964_05180 [Syntrophomonadaceae bacterium]|jgi:hypothetical protein|nr:hypothetical protein [Syntrophomonadaceae bacterium]
MKKIASIIFICMFMVASVVTADAYALEKEKIEFGEINIPSGYSEVASHDVLSGFQLWHYSGGYWGNETYGIKLMDKDVAKKIKYDGIIDYTHPITVKKDLPNKVKEYVNNDGNISEKSGTLHFKQGFIGVA